MWTRDFEEAGENLQSELPVFNILFCFHEQICGDGGDGYLALVLVFSRFTRHRRRLIIILNYHYINYCYLHSQYIC